MLQNRGLDVAALLMGCCNTNTNPELIPGPHLTLILTISLGFLATWGLIIWVYFVVLILSIQNFGLGQSSCNHAVIMW